MRRQDQLTAALLLFDKAYTVSPLSALWNSEAEQDVIEESLAREVRESQEKLRNYRESRALRLALDSLLPGWRYIDASDYLPREKWRAFISDSREEWEAWLRGQSVPERAIVMLLSHW